MPESGFYAILLRWPNRFVDISLVPLGQGVERETGPEVIDLLLLTGVPVFVQVQAFDTVETIQS